MLCMAVGGVKMIRGLVHWKENAEGNPTVFLIKLIY